MFSGKRRKPERSLEEGDYCRRKGIEGESITIGEKHVINRNSHDLPRISVVWIHDTARKLNICD